jgi:hypothetical protein
LSSYHGGVCWLESRALLRVRRYAAFAIILALAIYGFRSALAARPVFEIGD